VQASFLEFAPAYFEHMAHAAATNTPTTLAKIAGVYSISLKPQAAQSTGQVCRAFQKYSGLPYS
jgi:hypothetical protein